MSEPTIAVAKKTGRTSPHAGKKIKRLTAIKKGTFPAVDALKSAKDRALLSVIVGAKKVDEVMGVEVTYAVKDGDKTAKVNTAALDKAVELKLVELV